ncbi:hypothetical protein F8O01_08655 [Pseudoclavibacter chungangensis]|uniref:Tetratricopeptide repeat protein n=1 Tax=Pseudoclavibacter chungangensis TaxID=587635 RepID=A0A7J5BSN5_9MICO|nr:hypothetical protein [Pseudoclavibacter chungangensis]KAB1657303.1 hypothetical protein F8O01_08655 [Pseudoclavibacter chungangensis]NYJ66248.1 tetratricopeptide (TPR) repeat protein [Pseudoclavibacter chungangensis]
MTSGTTADIAAPTAIEAPHERADPERQRAERERAALRRRRRAMVWGLPFSLVALLVAAKLISMVLVGQATVAKYEDADYEGALNSAQQQKILNVIEQWKAPYSTGTTYLQLGLNDEARAELESALPLAGGIDQCPVRSNLAIAIERQGDAMLDAGDSEGARDHWTQALAVLEQQPAECTESTSKAAMDESEQRIRAKLDPPPPDAAQEPEETPPPEQEDELEDQLEENQQDRQDLIDENSGSGGGGTDKPW